MIIFDKIRQYNYKGSFEGWLKRITINTAIQKYKKSAPLELIKEVPNTQEENVNLDEKSLDIDTLLQYIQSLPDRYRMVFNLYVLDDYTHKEIAKLLHISEGTSKSNLSRARKLVQQKLEAHKKKKGIIS